MYPTNSLMNIFLPLLLDARKLYLFICELRWKIIHGSFILRFNISIQLVTGLMFCWFELSHIFAYCDIFFSPIHHSFGTLTAFFLSLLCSFFQVCADIIMFRIIRCGNFVMVLVHKKLYLNATAILIASSLSLSHTHTHTHTHPYSRLLPSGSIRAL